MTMNIRNKSDQRHKLEPSVQTFFSLSFFECLDNTTISHLMSVICLHYVYVCDDKLNSLLTLIDQQLTTEISLLLCVTERI